MRVPRLRSLITLCQRILSLPYSVATGSLCALIVLALLAGFVPGRRGGELRLPLNVHNAPQQEEWLNKRPLDTTAWMLRRPVNTRAALPGPTSGGDADALIEFTAGGVSILTVEGPRLVSPNASRVAAGNAGPEEVFQFMSRQTLGLPSGLSLAPMGLVSGRPAALCPTPPGSGSASAEAARRAWRAGRSPYGATVDAYADKFGLDRHLVYAIMYAESGFDPTLISNRDAHGLMQIVPSGAGHEVHTYLHGAPGQPSTAALLDPATNIQYGVTYLHLLMRRHMSGIKDSLSREYCVVASYNIGPNAVLKVFGASREEAFEAINAMNPIELYAALIERLPAAETRAFLRKVMLAKSGLVIADNRRADSAASPQ